MLTFMVRSGRTTSVFFSSLGSSFAVASIYASNLHCPLVCTTRPAKLSVLLSSLQKAVLANRFLPTKIGLMLLVFLSIVLSNSSTSSIDYHRNLCHLGAFSYLPQFHALFKHFLHLGLCSTFLLNISRKGAISLWGKWGICPMHKCYLINYLNAQEYFTSGTFIGRQKFYIYGRSWNNIILFSVILL